MWRCRTPTPTRPITLMTWSSMAKRRRSSWTTSSNRTSRTAHRAGTAVAVPQQSAPPRMPTAETPACMCPAEPSSGTVRPAVWLTSWKPAATTKSAPTCSMTATSTPTPRSSPSTCNTTTTARRTTTPSPPKPQRRANGSMWAASSPRRRVRPTSISMYRPATPVPPRNRIS